MNVGYARVSTADQNLDLQLDALKKAECEKIFQDIASGAKKDRPGLAEILEFIRPSDTLVVWKLDRLGRSLPHLVKVVTDLKNRNIFFMSIQEKIDTTSPGGKLIFHVFSALAEFERDIIRERTLAGLAAARARGRKGGRPNKVSREMIESAKELLADGKRSVAEVARMLHISKTTLYRYLK